MTGPNISLDINLGQMLVVGAVSALGWGLRKIYMAGKASVDRVTHFIERIHEDAKLLDMTTSVVDDHTRVLIQAELLKVPVVRLARGGRRVNDTDVFTKDDLS